jgi:protease-4
MALGLVDALGGFPVALNLAREAIGMPVDAPIHLKVFPKRKTLLKRVLGKASGSNERDSMVAALVPVLKGAEPVAQLAKSMGLGSEPGALTMPDIAPKH